jgi:GNAT superfamily N-acetyltransferase
VNESVTVETLGSISPNDAAALARLLGQLSTTATFDKGRLHTIISHEATELLVARVGGEIVGIATFVSFPLPTGLRGHVEDVVVDESMRGRGIARKLLETMTTIARGARLADARPHLATVARIGSAALRGSRVLTTSNEHPPIHPLASLDLRRSPPKVQRYDRPFAVEDLL